MGRSRSGFVAATIADRLGNMASRHPVDPVKIGERACYPQDARIGPRGQGHGLRRVRQQGGALRSGVAIFPSAPSSRAALAAPRPPRSSSRSPALPAQWRTRPAGRWSDPSGQAGGRRCATDRPARNSGRARRPGRWLCRKRLCTGSSRRPAENAPDSAHENWPAQSERRLSPAAGGDCRGRARKIPESLRKRATIVATVRRQRSRNRLRHLHKRVLAEALIPSQILVRSGNDPITVAASMSPYKSARKPLIYLLREAS